MRSRTGPDGAAPLVTRRLRHSLAGKASLMSSAGWASLSTRNNKSSGASGSMKHCVAPAFRIARCRATMVTEFWGKTDSDDLIRLRDGVADDRSELVGQTVKLSVGQ